MSATKRQFKNAAYEQLARIGKALAAPKRLELLDLLSQGPRTVEALAGEVAISLANASQHLQILRAARLVESVKQGLHVRYALADDGVSRLLHEVQQVARARLAEITRVTQLYLEERGALEAVDGEELIRRVRAGAVTVLDVRPAEEYSAGHIPGAISVPLSELKKRFAELPRKQEIVAYCRGPYCVMAIDAVELLRKKGFRAHRMEQGVVEWKARGFRVATRISEGRT